MRILWSVNTLMPKVAKKLGIKSSHAISWVDAMSKRLMASGDIELAIVSPTDNAINFKVESDGIIFYLIKETGSNEEWLKVLSDFRPDIIHLYGTEKGHNLPLLEMSQSVPVVISLQGILTEYERFYYGGIDVSTLIKNITIRDIIRGTVFKERKNFQRLAKCEQKMLNMVKYVEGRTEWDRVAATTINDKLMYYYCPRLLRNAFYECEPWSVDTFEPHTIFIHQGNYPIKGLHFVLEALALLRKRYPDVRLYVAGNDIINRKTTKDKLKRNGYSKYLKKLVDRYDLSNCITFTGYLTAEQLAKKLSVCNVMVIPSSIENSPNSLAEAELVGVPCVASYVGGNYEMLRDNQDGFLYCYNEPGILAEKVSQIFDSVEIAHRFSQSARAFAMKRHDPQTLETMLRNIYNDVIEREKV